MAATCDTPNCGREIPPQTGPGRPRKKCDTCRPSSLSRKTDVERAQVVDLPVRLVTETIPVGTVTAAVSARLAQAGREDDPAGRGALYAAQALDEGGHNASGIASLLKEMRACLDQALQGAVEAEDIVDDLRSRRGRAPGAPA